MLQLVGLQLWKVKVIIKLRYLLNVTGHPLKYAPTEVWWHPGDLASWQGEQCTSSCFRLCESLRVDCFDFPPSCRGASEHFGQGTRHSRIAFNGIVWVYKKGRNFFLEGRQLQCLKGLIPDHEWSELSFLLFFGSRWSSHGGSFFGWVTHLQLHCCWHHCRAGTWNQMSCYSCILQCFDLFCFCILRVIDALHIATMQKVIMMAKSLNSSAIKGKVTEMIPSWGDARILGVGGLGGCQGRKWGQGFGADQCGVHTMGKPRACGICGGQWPVVVG